jgi:uncharacterized protein
MRLFVGLSMFLLLTCPGAEIAAAPLSSPANQAPSAPPDANEPGSVAGDWYGALTVPGGTLHLKLTITERDHRAFSAAVVSIDQGGVSIPVSTVTVPGDSLHLGLGAIAAAFDGLIRGAGESAEIAGNWSQGGMTLPLTFKRTGHPPEAKRPQVPQKPYPYREEEVSFENPKAGAKFAATLTLPPGQGPFPAVLLITGSGLQDRDETILGHRPFLILADYLTRRGIATLRADDRGVGGSTGDVAGATTADFAEDARAGVAYLKTRTEIDPKRIGLVGHSEGATIASIAATQSSDVDFIVMLAGMGVVGEDVLYLQGWRQLQAQGFPQEMVARERALQEGFFAAVKEEKDDAAAEKRIRDVCRASGKNSSEEEITATVKEITSPWFRYFLAFDPRPVLQKVRCPVLALSGEKDTQVTPKENAPAVEAALKAAGNKDYTVRVLPGLNHLFQTCRTGTVAEYGQIEETFAPSALGIIGDWIEKHTAKQ